MLRKVIAATIEKRGFSSSISSLSISIDELEICPSKIVALLNSTLQHGILTQTDMKQKGLSYTSSSDIFSDPNEVRVNLVSGRHGRPIGAVIELTLSKESIGAHSVVLEQPKDTLLLRASGDLRQRKVQLELSERAMHSILVLIKPELISEAIGNEAFRHDDTYSNRTPDENRQPPFEYTLQRSISPSSFIKVLASNQIIGYLPNRLPLSIPLSLVPEKMVAAHYFDALSGTTIEVKILAPDFEPELRSTLEARGLIFSHALRGDVPRTREIEYYCQIAERHEVKGELNLALDNFYYAYKLQENNIILMIKIGDLCKRKNTFENFKKAGKYYMQAIKVNPLYFEAQVKMAEIYETLALKYNFNKTSLLQKALKHYTEALKINPSDIAISEKVEAINKLL